MSTEEEILDSLSKQYPDCKITHLAKKLRKYAPIRASEGITH